MSDQGETAGLPTDRDELATALAGFRDREFARWFLFAFALVAEQHPDELRRAVGTVFDVRAIEEANRRMSLVLARTQADLAAISDDVREALRHRGQLRQEVDFLRERCRLMNAWMNRHSALVKGIIAQQKKPN